MNNTETRTLEQVVVGLAMREHPCRCTLGPACPYCQSVHYEPGNAAQVHDTRCLGGCRGTGQVPEFPMLREECPNEGEDVNWSKDGIHTSFGYRIFQDQLHEPCGGRGWLPVCTTDALLDALKPYSFWLNWSVGLRHWVVAKPDIVLGLRVIATGDSSQMGLALALEAANKENSPTS